MKRIDRLIFATNNGHKLEEAHAILGSDMELMSLADIGCHDDIPETSPTLEGNALQKARYIHEKYGVDCIADDTGLMVDALDGAPGVHSARYATSGHDSAANMRKLLAELQDKQDRKAHFSTVIALVTSEGEQTFEGSVHGTITRAPHGENGFGYDPVFRADETGRTFAEMDGEEKNAISHRGRALRAFRDWLKTLAIMICLLIPAVSSAASQWRFHPSYDGDILRVIDTKDFAYFVTLKQVYEPANAAGTVRYGSLLRYDKENDEWKWLDRSTGLSENIISDAIYDYDRDLLCLTYRNGNIDVISKKGKTNIPGLMLSNGEMSKEVRSLSTDPATGRIWIATANGYLSIDPAKGEVVTNRNFKRDVNCVASFGDKLFVGTPEGLYYGDMRTGNFESMQRLGNVEKVLRLIPLGNDRLYVCSSDAKPRRMHYVEKSGDNFSITPCSGENVYSVEPGNDGLLIWEGQGLSWIDKKDYSVATTAKPSVIENSTTRIAASSDGKEIWFTVGRDGFSRFTAPRNGGEWTLTMDEFFPNVSRAFKCVEMAYHPEYGMMVRGHGNEQGFTGKFLYLSDRLSALKNGEWTPLALNYTLPNPPAALALGNPNGVAVDPRNSNHVYCGSMQDGILRIDLSNPEKSIHLSRSNTAGADNPNFITVAEPPKAWSKMCNFATPKFDNEGNLWTIFFNPDDASRLQIRVWTPDDRLATTGKADYRPMKELDYDIKMQSSAKILPLLHASNKNLLILDGGSWAESLYVVDTAGTPTDRSDDRVYPLATYVDQDGVTFTNHYLEAIYEDPSTGNVWIGGREGVFYFNPAEVVKGNTGVRRIKVARNDGTGLADYLLDGAWVTHIVAEPSGRKWFSTLGAGIVVTSADGREVIRTFNTTNSELPHDNVHGLAYNPANNSMMISTEEGLCEYFLSRAGSDSDSDNNVRAYPNPVRPGYAGFVTIDGLPDNAAVKVTDSAGNMVKELGIASGNEITWDITNLYNRRVPAGVYYILATNGPEGNSFTKVTKVLIVD